MSSLERSYCHGDISPMPAMFVAEGVLDVTFWGDTAVTLDGYDLDEILKGYATDGLPVRVTIEVAPLSRRGKETQ